jgi:hypothetical protein
MSVPTIGRTVLYLGAQDADAVNRRRTSAVSIAERIKVLAWPLGAQAHMGNAVKEGDVFPMMIVARWGTTETSSVNGQVFLDGSDVLWVTSVSPGEGPRTWSQEAQS